MTRLIFYPKAWILSRHCLVLLLAWCFLLGGCKSAREAAHRTWRVYKGNPTSSSYSSLDQIDRSNVGRLQKAWTFHTGDEGVTIECNPIAVDGVLYVTSPSLRVIALRGATGKEIWSFNPFKEGEAQGVNRGVAYWADGEDQRILFTAGPFLYALDADTGRPIDTFGQQGRVDLRDGLGRNIPGLNVAASTPGTIYKNLLILGSTVGEGPGPTAPGHIRAYSVRSGELKWVFHTIPYPGEFGYDTWPEGAWKRAGGANSWAGMSLDEERGIVFAPTGSPAYDHHGGDRAGKNLFANTVLALDARTGERVWHFQAVHHDIWDYDLASPPNLVTVQHGGKEIDAVAQVTKMGHLFLLDRQTGEPLFPVEERPVPASKVPGEATWPTQPFPTKPAPYARQGFAEEDVTRRTPAARKHVMKYLRHYGPGRLFDPPSRKGEIVMPQFNGGTDWGGAAFDPGEEVLYVNASNVPELISMAEAGKGADHTYPYIAMGHQPIRDDEGYPISKPPWGTLSAIDLNGGEIAWRVPLGDHPEARGTDQPATGTFNMGGPIVTAGGLVFIGATKDEKFRAFDKVTGEVLWETDLPAGGYATPATYSIEGKQYVIIAAGGGGKPGTPTADAYVAFALP